MLNFGFTKNDNQIVTQIKDLSEIIIQIKRILFLILPSVHSQWALKKTSTSG